MDAQACSELEAIDAALGDEPVGREHAELAELIQELRASRPRPRGEFVEVLDMKAAQGFVNAGGRSRRWWTKAEQSEERIHAPHELRRLRPALGVGLALALAVALPFAITGGPGASRKAVPHMSARTATAMMAPAAGTSARSAREDGVVAAQPAPVAPQATSASAAGASARQVERTATLELGVAPSSIESASRQVFTLVSSFNGYVRQSNVSSGGPGQGGASFDLRIPTSKLVETIAALSQLGHVRSENDTTNDVTDQYSSLQRSLDDLQSERQKLLKQLAAAPEGPQEAALKSRLREVEGRISQLEARLPSLRTRVNYTSVALTLTAEAPVSSKRGDLTPGAAARDAGRILEAALAVLLIAAAALVPLGVVALAAFLIVTSTRRRVREQALDAS